MNSLFNLKVSEVGIYFDTYSCVFNECANSSRHNTLCVMLIKGHPMDSIHQIQSPIMYQVFVLKIKSVPHDKSMKHISLT